MFTFVLIQTIFSLLMYRRLTNPILWELRWCLNGWHFHNVFVKQFYCWPFEGLTGQCPGVSRPICLAQRNQGIGLWRTACEDTTRCQCIGVEIHKYSTIWGEEGGKFLVQKYLALCASKSEHMPIAHAYLRLCGHLVRSHCEVAALR